MYIENICCSNTWVDIKHILNHNPTPIKAQFLPLFNVNLSHPQLNSTSTQFQLDFDSTSYQPQINISFYINLTQLNLNLNLNLIWLWHKSKPILLSEVFAIYSNIYDIIYKYNVQFQNILIYVLVLVKFMTVFNLTLPGALGGVWRIWRPLHVMLRGIF